MIKNKNKISKEEVFNILKLYGEQNNNVVNLVDLNFEDMIINCEGIKALEIYNVHQEALKIYNDFQNAGTISNHEQTAWDYWVSKEI